MGLRDLGASGQEDLSVFQWSWICSQLYDMALPFLEQMFHPGEGPQTTFTLSLHHFLQKSLPMVPYVCIFHEGVEGVWDVPGGHIIEQQKTGQTTKSLELLKKNTVYEEVLGEIRGHIKWKGSTLFLENT